jgi:predicted RNase H-related nuclease YkuK (DUF458 family)
MNEQNKVIELTEEELHIARVISRLLKSGHIEIGVDVNTEPCHNGYFNVTNAWASVNGDYIELSKGSVEINVDER